MNIYVGLTDRTWFDFLRHREAPDEVNFWVPGKTITLPRLQPGELFLFKLHKYNRIVGGGVFAHKSVYPIGLAWQAFEQNNGAKTEQELRRLVEQYRGEEASHANYDIGCVILTQPFFWEENAWILSDAYWKAGTRQYKKHDVSTDIGRRLWDEVQTRMQAHPAIYADSTRRAERNRYGKPVLIAPRLGQGGFRAIITDVYGRKCAITQEKTLPVLQAAHIKPFHENGPNDIQNGILLRADLHGLLDSGYMTISPDYYLEISKRIRDDFDNGEEYGRLHGKQLILPSRGDLRPSHEFIRWHNENKYRG